MSENAGNTHVATAKFRQEGVHEWQSEQGITDATLIAAALDAQTEATLALTYEQRTANLIELARSDRVGGYVAHRDLWGTIEARLGQ